MLSDGSPFSKSDPKTLKFPPSDHKYTEHPTYTGPHCALCGQPREAHQETALAVL